ncbi:MAG: hypothetical protein ACXIU7_06550 [Roseinatronobacter sp.]
MTWFDRLMGFAELSYHETQKRLRIEGTKLVCAGASHAIGTLETPSLRDLRDAAAWRACAQGLQYGTVQGDVRALHRQPQYAGALFQVASQFNLLEMVDPQVTPEAGVSLYEFDPTQGPACAIACGAGTIYRNYLVPVAGQIGQTAAVQMDLAADLRGALARGMGVEPERLWQTRNGYVLPKAGALADIGAYLSSRDPARYDELRSTLRIGLHRDVEVTLDSPAPGQLVTQCYCSAMPVAYSAHGKQAWAPLARLVLEAAYEATLLAGLRNIAGGGSGVVLLTRLGGGAFGNDAQWIDDAIAQATRKLSGAPLDVRLVMF